MPAPTRPVAPRRTSSFGSARHHRRPRSSQLPPSLSLLLLLPLLIALPLLALRTHYALPAPILTEHDPHSGLPHFSTANVLKTVERLSEPPPVGFGHRIAGTREHVDTLEWLVGEVGRLKEESNVLRKGERGGEYNEVEVFVQHGEGTHRFDMMDRIVMKSYSLPNLIVRISSGTPSGKEHAVLVNAHIDSTLPSQGAADDALGVGIMLELLRIFSQTPGLMRHGVVLLWNGAEESLQDASHLYITQHETASSIRAVVNLEAAGNAGPEIVFQATSDAVIKAYQAVPRPYGQVMANDVFASGIVLSDTDFRQFVQYGNVSGLDMALIENSYMYHTRKDSLENLVPGSVQHYGENALAVLRQLTGPSSLLSTLPVGSLPPKPDTIYFSILHTWFVVVPASVAGKIYGAINALAVVLLLATARRERWRAYLAGFVGVAGSLVGGLVAANGVAALMSRGLGRAMSWFSHEFLSTALYGPPALAGILSIQLLLARLLPAPDAAHLEHATHLGLALFFSLASLALHRLGMGSSYLFALWGASQVVTLLLVGEGRRVLEGKGKKEKREGEERVWGRRAGLAVYAVGGIVPMVLGTECLAAFSDIFVPLTGRMGEIAPVDHIIASLVSFMTFIILPLSLPFMHRHGPAFARSVVLALALVSLASVVGFAKWPRTFDERHQKRVFFEHVHNITTGETHLHVGAADGAPGFETLVQEIAHEFGAGDAVYNVMDEWNSDWDILYPFSQFVTPYRIPLAPSGPSSEDALARAFTVTAEDVSADRSANTRTLTLRVSHAGFIWPVVAFDADVLSWSLDSVPTPGLFRHHIKRAATQNVTEWTMQFTLRGADAPLRVQYSAIEELGMWPSKAVEGRGRRSVDLLGRVDGWMEGDGGSLGRGRADCLLLGVVAGAVEV